MIDAVRAARALGDRVGAGSRYAIIGYSQGGQAALFANQIAASWAPELRLVGTVAGAPPVELATWLAALTGPEWDWLVAMVVAGFEAVDPSADPALVLSASGWSTCRWWTRSARATCCPPSRAAGIGRRTFARTAPFDALLAANTPGQVAGAGPVLLLGGAADTLIPPQLLDLAQARLCALGQPLDRRTYPDVDHDGIIAASLVDAAVWAAARFAGTPVDAACP